MANDPHKWLTFDHQDGRVCHYSTMTGEWYHWDNPVDNPTPGPRDRVEYRCEWRHPGDSSQLKGDRGGFGMPTLGVNTTYITDAALSSISTIKGSPYPDHLRADITEVRLTEKPTTHEAIRIIGQWLPECMERFLRNNTKYARAQVTDLGDKGIMPDINRKTSVLMDRIWFGAEEVGEPTVEVIDDLIGHLFLLRDKISNKEED